MAQLPPDGEFVIQHNDGVLVISRYGEDIAVIPAREANDFAVGQKTIYDMPELTPEQKCYAHFWSGYFYAYSNLNSNL